MNRTPTLLLAAVLCAAPGLPPRAGRAAAQTPDAPATMQLDEAARELVRSSRAAIVGAGFSARYFDRHFEPFRVVNREGDRRVVWRFRAGEHEAYVNDSVGSYTDGQGRRQNTHSAAATLGAAHDIGPTITRRRAEELMRACIGEFEGGAVAFQQFGPRARTALVFTAASVPPAAPAAAPAPTAPAPREGDFIREGRKKNPPIYLGAVNLETGRCLKGRAQVGSPKPDAEGGEAPARPRQP